jgi:hypothetical protein
MIQFSAAKVSHSGSAVNSSSLMKSDIGGADSVNVIGDSIDRLVPKSPRFHLARRGLNGRWESIEGDELIERQQRSLAAFWRRAR